MRIAYAAAGVAGVALAAGGLVASTQIADTSSLSSSVSTTTALVQETTPPCTAVTSRGQIADPCNVELRLWQESNRNALQTMPYAAKWKAANPNEYATLRAFSTSAPQTPEPTVRTAFGALVRYGVVRCRTWALDVSGCALP